MRGIWAVLLIAALVLAGCTGKQPTPESSSPESSGTASTEKTDRTPETQGQTMPETAATEPETTEPTDGAGEPAETQTEPETCVHAQWAEDVFTDLTEYEQFILGMNEELPLVYFSTEHTVEDFKILSLTLESIDEEGNVNFTVEEIDYHGTLTPEEPLLVRMEFVGTIPNNGISYVDAEGATRYFLLNASGYDGSLLLTEFTPQEESGENR